MEKIKLLSISKLAKAANIDKNRMYNSVRDKDEPTNLSTSERKQVIEELKKAHEINVKYFDF
jgi:MoaA/NifB/PqqE/SkfB family radical SAM enzyme